MANYAFTVYLGSGDTGKDFFEAATYAAEKLGYKNLPDFARHCIASQIESLSGNGKKLVAPKVGKKSVSLAAETPEGEPITVESNGD